MRNANGRLFDIQFDVAYLGLTKNNISSEIEYPSRHIFAARILSAVGGLYIVPYDTGENCVPCLRSKITPYTVLG